MSRFTQLRQTTVLLCVFSLSSTMVATANADIVHTLGDVDFFGFGAGQYGIDHIATHDVDNREAGDPHFTDHDVRDSVVGSHSANDVSWSHNLSAVMPATGVEGVTLELALAGIQDLIQDGVASPEFDDRIFVEGIELPNALDNVDQGATGTAIFQFVLSEAQALSFASDGILDVVFDGGRRDRDGALESYFIDYSRVIVAVPEPNTALLLSLASSFCLLGRRRSH